MINVENDIKVVKLPVPPGDSPEGRRLILRNGYEPIPIFRKAPKWAGWLEGQITAERLAAVEAAHPDHVSTGLRTGRLAVVDVDVIDPEHASAVAEAVQAVLGETWLRRVGSKGMALLYDNPWPIRKMTVTGRAPGAEKPTTLVEILGVGQQVAAFGVHPDTGKPYDWSSGFGDPLDTRLDCLPEATPDKLRAAAEAARVKLTALGYADVVVTGPGLVQEESSEPSAANGIPVTEVMVREMLTCVDPACDRVTWIKVCGALKAAPVVDDDHDCLGLFDEWSSGQLHAGTAPKKYKGPDDCRKAWDSMAVDRVGGADFGSLVYLAREGGYTGRAVDLMAVYDALAHSPASEPVPASESAEDRPLTAAELATGDFPRASYLWRDLVIRGEVNTVHGDGGVGKSMLALQLAAAVASGRPLFGRAVETMPVLVVSCEDGPGEVRHRLTRACEDLRVDLADLPIRVWPRPGRDSTLAVCRDDGSWTPGPFLDALTAQIQSVGEPCLVVLDTVSDVAALDEVKRLPVNSLCKQVLGGLCHDHGATVLLLCHPSKASMADGTHYSGSTAWNNSVRNRLVLEAPDPKGEPRKRTLRVAKRNYGPSAAKLTLWMVDTGLALAQPADDHDQEQRERDAVLAVVLDLIDRGIAVLKANGNGQKPTDVARATNKEYGLHLDAKRTLAHLNDLERAGRLRYVRADHNKRAIQPGFQRPEA